MKILALEFSSSHRSVAVLDSRGDVLGSAEEINGRNSIALVEQALATAGMEREEIDALAVGLGPGSYAGIRGAIALAQGWQIGRSLQVIGIGSVDCVAWQAQQEKILGAVHIVIDAQRNEFYVARYDLTVTAVHLVEPLRLASVDEIKQLGGDARIIGPGALEWFPSAANLYPHAATLGKIAGARTDFVTADQLEPIYLRATTFRKAPPRRIVS